MKNGKVNLKIVSFLLSLLLASNVFAGCTSKTQEAAPKDSGKPAETSKVTYPIKTDVTLKYWLSFSSQYVKDFNEAPVAKELQKKTGIKVEYINPASGTGNEAFNLMLASGDLPDIIEYAWSTFPGGAEKAISDGYILKLNDTINKYAPNLKAFYNSKPEMSKIAKTDSGSYYSFPFFRQDEFQLVFQGPVIRKDWLDNLGLQMPTTMDEWYTVLKAFKDKKDATAPLSLSGLSVLNNGAFTGAYGVKRDFYLDGDGKVKYGPAEPGYKEFLVTMKKWYAEGLLDKNFSTTDSKILNANMTGGKSGATIAYAGGGIGTWMQTMQGKDPKYKLVGAPYPVKNKGEKPKFGQMDYWGGTYGAAISAKSKNAEIAARYLDYNYSKEGHIVANFGVEGDSFKMVNGEPQYTEVITNNPNKMSRSDAAFLYAITRGSGPAVQDVRLQQTLTWMPEQQEAIKVWQNTDEAKYKIPSIIPSPAESSDMAKIMNDVKTYVDEMTTKFIMGTAPIEDFDKYVSQIKNLGIDKAISIEEAAIKRYNNR